MTSLLKEDSDVKNDIFSNVESSEKSQPGDLVI